MKTLLLYVIIIGSLLFSLQSCKNENKENPEKEIKAEKQVEIETPKLKSVEVNDYNFNYLDIGKGEPVVFVHGTVGDYRIWEAQMDAFSENHRVIALSRRYAYPNSQIVNDSTNYGVTIHSQDLTQFLKTLDIGPVHLIGHSYGAFTSLLTTLENPELVKTLTLGEPPVMSFLQYIPEGEKLGNEFVNATFVPAAEAFKNDNDKKAVELFIASVMDDSLYFSNAPKKLQNLMTDNITELKGMVFSENLFPPLECGDIKKIKTPVLLIKGENSPEIILAITDELDKCIVNSELKILPDSSHGLELENPQEFNKIVLEFIGKN